MTVKYGTIISTNGARAKVSMKHAGACSGDHEGCPWNVAIGITVPKELIIDAENPIGAVQGDLVEVSLPGSQLVNAAGIVYMLPLFSSFIGAVSGYFLGAILEFKISLSAIMGSVAGICAGFYFVSILDKYFRNNYVIKNVIYLGESNMLTCCK